MIRVLLRTTSKCRLSSKLVGLRPRNYSPSFPGFSSAGGGDLISAVPNSNAQVPQTTPMDDLVQQDENVLPIKLGPFLLKYGSNLTKAASDGKLDPVIGRDEEIKRAIQILSRRSKNNPVFIGEPGVGKTAIAEGLARRIVMGDVPSSMRNKVICSLDLASMLSGAKFRGEFEERLKGVLKDIEQAGERIILFIDEIHVLVGAGGAEGAIDASNILKPPLARGQLRCMGATTTDEFRKYIEKDAALARRFQAIVVKEPSVDDTVIMLKGTKAKFEAYHGVQILDKALEAAAKLSHRYISDRRMPDKAIDLVDEASSKLRMVQESVPVEIVELDKQLADIAMRGKDGSDETKIKAKRQMLMEQWSSTKKLLKDISEARVYVDVLSSELVRVTKLGNYTRAKEIESVELLDKENAIKNMYKELATLNTETAVGGLQAKFAIGEEDIAEIVSANTGIPLANIVSSRDGSSAKMLVDGEVEKLLHLQEALDSRVMGQSAATKIVAEAIQRSRAGMSDPSKPIATLIFLGPTGKKHSNTHIQIHTYILALTRTFTLMHIHIHKGLARRSFARRWQDFYSTPRT